MVRVIDDMAEVHRLQKEHGGWDDDMALVSLILKCCLCVSFSIEPSCKYSCFIAHGKKSQQFMQFRFVSVTHCYRDAAKIQCSVNVW